MIITLEEKKSFMIYWN